MKLSVILPAHNHAKLLKRAMDGYARQTLQPEDWEIILVDEMSKEDLSTTYEHLLGDVNVTHVRMDPSRHPSFLGNHSRWSKGEPGEGRHAMPALSINLGISLAKGRTLCLCHPEILHAPTNFEAAENSMQDRPGYLFGCTVLGTSETNRYLDETPDWALQEWSDVLASMRADTLRTFTGTELYWHTVFLPKSVAMDVGGVDLEYLRGVAGDDDDFRERVAQAGCRPRMDPALQVLHQYHTRESRPQDLAEWTVAARRNRVLYGTRRCNWSFPRHANPDVDWTGGECIVSFRRFELSSATHNGRLQT